MSEAQLAYGSTIERSSDGGTTWVSIPEAKIAPVPKSETDYVEVTSLDSAGGYREYIPGLKDAGEIEVTANYTRAGYQQQAADEASGAAIMYRTTFENSDKFEFSGFPSVSVESSDVGEARMMTINIRITGSVTFTAGA